MSAVPREGTAPATLRELTTRTLNEVMQIEIAAYRFPWTRGNFIDSIAAAHLCWTLHDAGGALLGYCVAMRGAGEMHLLNITVAAAARRRGHARHMLETLCERAARDGDDKLWLEVRVGNAEARTAYRRLGFSEVGVRKDYYPATDGRENAVVMSLAIAPARHAATD